MTGITADEKKLLSALVHFPEETDRRLGAMAGLEPLKATYLRTRMQKLGIFRFLRVPAFSRLGAGVFLALVLETGTGWECRGASERLRGVLGGMPNIFWAFGNAGKAVALGIFRSPAEAAGDISRLEKEPGVNVIGSFEMPVSALVDGKFLDFSGLLEMPPGVSGDGPKGPADMDSARIRPLFGFEKEALQALVDFPDDGYTALARRLGISMKVFSERTGELGRGKFLRTVAVPDIRLLGMDSLAVWTAGGAGVKTPADNAAAKRHIDLEPASRPEEPLEDGPVSEADIGDPLMSHTGMAREQDSVLPEGLPAGLRDDWLAPEGVVRGRCRAEARAKKQALQEPGAKDGAGGPPKETLEVRMPWQAAPMQRTVRPRYDGPRPYDTSPSGAKRGIEAIPKDIARTLIGRPSKETVEQAKAELERRRIWDVDLEQILIDAGVIPARRTAPAAPPLPPAWVGLSKEAGPLHPFGGVEGRVTVEGDRGRAIPDTAGARVTITSPSGLVMTVPLKRKRGRPPKVRLAPEEMARVALETAPGIGGLAAVPLVKRKPGRPPRVRLAPEDMAPVVLDRPTVSILAAGNDLAPVVKRKRGRPRKHPANGNIAMVMERFSTSVDDGKGPACREGAGSGPAAMPVFLDAQDGGRRFMIGLFRERSDVDRAGERLRDEAGAGLELHLMPVGQLEILKPLDFGAVTRRLLGLD